MVKGEWEGGSEAGDYPPFSRWPFAIDHSPAGAIVYLVIVPIASPERSAGPVVARFLVLAAAIAAIPAVAAAQAPELTGTWRVDAGADVKNGPREVIIRADSSASWGRETVRWRVVKDKIWIAIGGEWEIYDLKLKARELTLSGGDLTKAVTLKRTGPPTPRPAGVPVPPDPGT